MLLHSEDNTLYNDALAETKEKLSHQNTVLDKPTEKTLSSYKGTPIALVQASDTGILDYGENLQTATADLYGDLENDYDILITFDTGTDSVFVASDETLLMKKANQIIDSAQGKTISEKLSNSETQLKALVGESKSTISLTAQEQRSHIFTAIAPFAFPTMFIVGPLIIALAVKAFRAKRSPLAPAVESTNKVPEFDTEIEKFVWLKNYYSRESRQIDQPLNPSDEMSRIIESLRNLYEIADRDPYISRGVVEANNENLLKVLNDAFDPSLYLDMIIHPDFWNKPASRIQSALESLDLMQKYVSDEIANSISHKYDSPDKQLIERLSSFKSSELHKMYTELGI